MLSPGQIHIDIPRTNPLIPLFQQPTVQEVRGASDSRLHIAAVTVSINVENLAECLMITLHWAHSIPLLYTSH